MKNEGLIDEQEIRKSIEQLKPEHELFEVRIISNRGKIISGYFQDADSLITAFGTVDLRGTNVYITINDIQEGCSARDQFNRFIDKPKVSTSDSDIVSYEWLMLDFDPKRVSGVSSTKEEYQEAQRLAGKVYKYLQEQGFEDPVKAVSGNGAHLLYKIGLANTEDNQTLVKNVLNALALMFSTDKVDIDTTVYNPARICKLYGTLAQKGSNKPNRPHRMSRLRGDIREVRQTPRAYLEKICSWLPKEPERPSRYNNYQPQTFDLEEFMRNHGITYKVGSAKDSTMYILDECPFNSTHKNGDAKIFHYSNGAIAFKCHHNSCSGKQWQDVRLLFEPTAYERQSLDNDKRIEEGWAKHNRDKAAGEIPYMTQKPEDTELFYTAEMVLNQKEPEPEYIPTGITDFDNISGGLAKGSISVLTGLRGAAKSTLLNQISLNQVKDGRNVIVYSGELSSKRFFKWLYMQAAGKTNVEKYIKFDSYYCRPEVIPQIAKWLGDHIWLYNNNCGNDFQKVAMHIQSKIQATKADLCIIDNMMILEYDNLRNDKYDAQTEFVKRLKTIAELSNTHIIFVAHPRKAVGLLRLDDISGSGNIGNLVDNALIIHRNNEDFKRLSKQMFKWKDDFVAYRGDNVIEVCKDRENGTQDLYIPLWFEKETKRLKNTPSENIVYGDWKKTEQAENLSDGFDMANEDAPF